eukprot:4978542-Prymnesium_polylepis.1
MHPGSRNRPAPSQPPRRYGPHTRALAPAEAGHELTTRTTRPFAAETARVTHGHTPRALAEARRHHSGATV